MPASDLGGEGECNLAEAMAQRRESLLRTLALKCDAVRSGKETRLDLYGEELGSIPAAVLELAEKVACSAPPPIPDAPPPPVPR